MAMIEIYTRPMCGFCQAAKRLLDKKGASYSEIDIGRDPDQKAVMIDRAKGGRTFPQIFIDGTHIGGCDELYALDAAGKLDPMLTGSAAQG
ncbi:glutaredoxin 3 [Mesobaculum littorinae]|uniref:Glutaredoxin n=1 Tax=Mesobaculum littorinae TaxID=2486419 RepID=A0A438AHA2_9RHOB|nr:glutaredoxin 3 [Mesobaculum littorinae]RVV98101.1 glutaredoxin 3 [Mesobaculum littorinae]